MKKAIKIVNSWWFRSALFGAAAVALFITGDKMYAGIAIGAGARELLLAFKKPEACACDCQCCKDCDKCGTDKMLKS